MKRSFKIPDPERVNSMQYFQLLQFGSAILIGAVLAKSGISTGQISMFETLMFIGSFFCFFWITGGINSLLQLFPKLDEHSQKKALFNVLLLFTFAGLLVAFLLWQGDDFVLRRITNFDRLPYLNLLAIFVLINSPSFLVHIWYLLLRKYWSIIVFGTLSFTLQVVAVLVPVLLGLGIEGVMWGLIIWASMKLFWTIYLLQQFSIPEIDLPFWKKYIPRLMPLLLLALIGKGSEYLNNLMVSILFEEEKAFAIYRYGAREFPISVLLVSALSTSLLPLLSENLHSGLEAIRDATRKLSHFLFPASILTLLLSPVIFPIVFSQDFRDSARIFNIFGLLLGSRILMPQVVLMAHQRNMFLTYAAIVEMAILTSLSYILGGRFGMEGVAAAMVISFMIERIILICYCWHNLGVRPDSYIHWPTWVVYNGLLYLFFGISYLLY